ncbi:hypothetical protein Scep_006950 [Stephania cephalantha]|uniref:Uncharacterized protein n=1 Tax=Stephania cephalantha TaxID=152367 RepID=A0AAP0PKK9_9MAGN
MWLTHLTIHSFKDIWKKFEVLSVSQRTSQTRLAKPQSRRACRTVSVALPHNGQRSSSLIFL